jgi:hypothetical protein
MGYVQPTVTDFKQYFVRDFPYGADMETSVLDADINRAMTESAHNFPEGLFDNQGEYFTGFMLLSAHNLVLNLRASSQGLSGKFPWLTAGHGAGSVNESLAIPQRILDNPEFSWLSMTNYGAKYLAMVLPQLTGNLFCVAGRTLP